ncbi:MAG: hypothetical protein ABJR05_09440 [Balneola sp.]
MNIEQGIFNDEVEAFLNSSRVEMDLTYNLGNNNSGRVTTIYKRLIRLVFQNIAGLAVEGFADCF